jgi:hypothetical protein
VATESRVPRRPSNRHPASTPPRRWSASCVSTSLAGRLSRGGRVRPRELDPLAPARSQRWPEGVSTVRLFIVEPLGRISSTADLTTVRPFGGEGSSASPYNSPRRPTACHSTRCIPGLLSRFLTVIVLSSYLSRRGEPQCPWPRRVICLEVKTNVMPSPVPVLYWNPYFP